MWSEVSSSLKLLWDKKICFVIVLKKERKKDSLNQSEVIELFSKLLLCWCCSTGRGSGGAGTVSPPVPYHWYITGLQRSSWPRPPYFSICYINIVFSTWPNIYYSDKISNYNFYLWRYRPLLALPKLMAIQVSETNNKYKYKKYNSSVAITEQWTH